MCGVEKPWVARYVEESEDYEVGNFMLGLAEVDQQRDPVLATRTHGNSGDPRSLYRHRYSAGHVFTADMPDIDHPGAGSGRIAIVVTGNDDPDKVSIGPVLCPWQRIGQFRKRCRLRHGGRRPDHNQDKQDHTQTNDYGDSSYGHVVTWLAQTSVVQPRGLWSRYVPSTSTQNPVQACRASSLKSSEVKVAAIGASSEGWNHRRPDSTHNLSIVPGSHPLPEKVVTGSDLGNPEPPISGASDCHLWEINLLAVGVGPGHGGEGRIVGSWP